MNSNLLRSMTAFTLTVSALATGWASDDGRYGAAPASLDYPADAFSVVYEQRLAENAVTKKAWRAEELASISPINPFPSRKIPLIDPITKEKVDGIKIGPAIRTRSHGSNYDYYRYVTFYKIEERKERFYELMIQRELCHEKGDLFANYTSSTEFSATVTASVNLKMLGLSASFTKSSGVSTGHGISATGGKIADNIPYILFQDWYGQTFIELLDSKTGKTAFLTKPRASSPWWVFALFPWAASDREYPMPFRAIGAEKTFLVEKKIIQYCNTEYGTP